MALIDNLVSYYKLDENAANTDVEDIHGANDGTASENTSGLSVAGKINTAFDLDGDNDYVTIPDSVSLDFTDGITLSAWIKPDAAALIGFKRILTRDDNGTNRIWLLALNSGKISFQVWDSASNKLMGVANLNGTTTLTAGIWYHVAGTYSDADNYAAVYINGNEENHLTPTGLIKTGTEEVFIGIRFDLIEDFDGVIDECAIFDAAKSSAEMTSFYNEGNGLAYPFVVGTNMKINIGDVFKDIESLKINIGNVWKNVIKVQQNIGDVWKDVFG